MEEAIHTSHAALEVEPAAREGMPLLGGRKRAPTHPLSSFSLHIWPCAAVDEIVEVYAKDLQLKRLMVEDAVTQTNRDVLMSYLTAWEMMPYIDIARQEELLETLSLGQRLTLGG